MSDDKVRPDSQKSRQKLLDEIYYLRDLAGEREQKIRWLQRSTEAGARAIAELDRVLRSRSWRLTAPLRWLAGMSGRLSAEPRRSMSEKSRQELLDEIHYLRNVADEREQQIRRLQAGGSEAGECAIAELDRVLRSRSWRSTAPLRSLARTLGLTRQPQPETATAPSQNERSPTGVDSRDRRGDMAHLSMTSVRETHSPGKKHLYVDVTELALHEGRTGVQRVTLEILRALLTAPPDGYVIRPVYAAPGQSYRLAERFTARLRGSDETRPDESKRMDVLMDARTSDVFLGLDHSMQAVVERAADLDAIHAQGVRIWFVCNDTLPLVHPEWFPAAVHQRFESWLRTVAGVADGVACISRATEVGLHSRLDAWNISRLRPLTLAHFGLGADLAPPAADAATLTKEESALLKRLSGKLAFLMVGTLEPRKGHAQTLEAFNLLWARGDDVTLVIAGLPGWMTEVVQRRIRHHDEFGRRLFWFMGASDALLERLYATCTVLLAPSEGEGFGLPLIEAARHGLPILCRDLPVFREVAGEHATYFGGRDAESLAGAVSAWLDAWRSDAIPTTRGMHWITWAESARQLMGVVLGEAAVVELRQSS